MALENLKEFLEIQDKLEGFMRENKLSASDAKVIVFLGENNYGPKSSGINQVEVVKLGKMKPTLVYRTAARLKEEGYLEIGHLYGTGAGDRRVRPIKLTLQGEQLYSDMVELFDQMDG